MPSFQNHFGGHADAYARYRPNYPEALFAWLAHQAPGHDLAWDVGTGNGQAAVALAQSWRRVLATDGSAEQIAVATPHPRVDYRCLDAGYWPLDPGSADLICVAQALHWFDRPAFFAAARSALRPDGILAVWCYQTLRVDPAVDAIVDAWYDGVIGPWWPPGRDLVDAGYAGIDLPGEPIAAPDFCMERHWPLADLLGYLRTWSAVRRCLAATGADPVDAIAAPLAAAWGAPATRRRVVWPLALHVRRLS